MWIARDKDGELWVYEQKPIKKGDVWGISSMEDECILIYEDDTELFNDIQWSDEEPTEIKLIKK